MTSESANKNGPGDDDDQDDDDDTAYPADTDYRASLQNGSHGPDNPPPWKFSDERELAIWFSRYMDTPRERLIERPLLARITLSYCRIVATRQLLARVTSHAHRIETARACIAVGRRQRATRAALRDELRDALQGGPP